MAIDNDAIFASADKKSSSCLSDFCSFVAGMHVTHLSHLVRNQNYARKSDFDGKLEPSENRTEIVTWHTDPVQDGWTLTQL